MQENVRFFDQKLHKNAYFTTSIVHKNVKSVISMKSKKEQARYTDVQDANEMQMRKCCVWDVIGRWSCDGLVEMSVLD